MQVINLIDLISTLEDQKWDLVLKGAEVKPELQKQIEIIDRKLERLYRWYSTAYSNGLLNRYASTPFGPAVPKPVDRRKKSV
jgi:hypothetical protein